MKHFILPLAAAIMLFGTGCASGPGVVSLSSYLYGPAEEMYADETQAGPQPGDKVVERVVEEVPVERVVRETVVREVPVERVVTEREVIIERPDRVYISGGWYDPTEVVVTHVHGPGCGHYFHNGIWYNDPDLIVLDAYSPGCRYVCYDGLWYPRSDIFITAGYYHRRRSHVGSVVIWGAGAWPLPWLPTYWHHRHRHPYWERDRDVDIDIDIHNYGDGHGRDGHGGGRAPKAGEGGKRLQKGPLIDRRVRPTLVNDTVRPETLAELVDVPMTGLKPRPWLAQKEGRTGSGVAQSSRGAPGSGARVRSAKEPRGADNVKSPRTTSEVAKRSASSKDPRSVAGQSSLLRSPRPVYRGARPVSGRAVSRTTARQPFPTVDQTKSARTVSRVPSSAADSRSVRKPDIVNSVRSSNTDRSRTTAAPRSTFSRDTSERKSRPVLDVESGRTTAAERSNDNDSRRSTRLTTPRYSPPTRSVRQPGVIDTSRSTRSSRTSTRVIRSRSTRSSAPTTIQRQSRPSVSWSDNSRSAITTPSRSTRSLRSTRTISPSRSYKAPRTSSTISRRSTTPSRSSFTTRSTRSARSPAPSVRSSRSTSSIGASRSTPSRSSSMSSRASSSSARSARSSARSSGARAARSAR